MARKHDTCSTPGCAEALVDRHGKLTGNRKRQLCGKCASNFYRWRHRPKRELIARRKQLTFWTGRLDWLFGEGGER